MPFLPRDRVFVDESKSRGYILAATAAQPSDVAGMEREVRGLLLAGQRRIHFKAESRSRRREILSRLATIAPRVTVYVAEARDDKVGRATTLTELVADAVAAGGESLVLEADESLISADRRFIRERLLTLGAADALRYEHADPARFPLLWISDATAWCIQAGDEWLRRARPLIAEVKRLEKNAGLARRTVRKTARPTSRG